MTDRKHLMVGAAASVLVHAAVLYTLWRAESPARVQAAASAAGSVIEFELVNPPAETPTPPALTAPIARPERRRNVQRSEPSKPRATSVPGFTEEVTEGPRNSGAASDSSDAPRRELPTGLVPRAPFLAGASQADSAGQRPSPFEIPIPAANGLAETASERLRQGLDLALTAAAATDSTLRRPELVAAALGATADAAASGRGAELEPAGRPPAASARQTERYGASHGALGDFERARVSMESLRSFSEGARAGVAAQIEIRRQGRRFDVSLVRVSWSAEFDGFLLRRTRQWVEERSAVESDAFMQGIRRTLWQVELRAHFRQDLKTLSLPDVVGLAATSVVTGIGKSPIDPTAKPSIAAAQRSMGAALTLNFDDTTGRTEVINLGRAQYRVEFRLVEEEPEPRDDAGSPG